MAALEAEEFKEPPKNHLTVRCTKYIKLEFSESERKAWDEKIYQMLGWNSKSITRRLWKK